MQQDACPARNPADLYLLQEVDLHTRRAGNRDVAAELASRLRLNGAYAIEFEELSQESGRPAYIGQATLTNPGSDWHAVATGDFFGDGHTDILWQSTDGTPGIWQMNGTTIVSESALPNPGTSWQGIGTGDFTGDGKAGILWRGTDGTIGVWTMDGMTPTTMAAVPNSTSNANSVQASQPTMHGSVPEMAGTAGANTLVPGTQNYLQQLTSGTGLHLT